MQTAEAVTAAPQLERIGAAAGAILIGLGAVFQQRRRRRRVAAAAEIASINRRLDHLEGQVGVLLGLTLEVAEKVGANTEIARAARNVLSVSSEVERRRATDRDREHAE